jgi:hypothetical protein
MSTDAILLANSSLPGRANTFLPSEHWLAHDMCFFLHDLMGHLLASGEQAGIFGSQLSFRDEADKKVFEELGDVFAWLDKTQRVDERVELLVKTIFPAVLSDMLHCLYEALETSRKAKLATSFMLLRKPLQESLFLFESVVVDREDFARKLMVEPQRLYSQGAGGVAVHAARVQKVLDILGEADRFDAAYLAQLRYDKSAADGFDGVCNKAMHLFTDHAAIKTEPMNINFVFTDGDSRATQWSYLYSRLPYLLAYTHRIIEHVCATFAPSPATYLQDIDRRISAFILLWWDRIEHRYQDERLRQFVLRSRDRLFAHCEAAGYRAPSRPDLRRMAEGGAFPGEPDESVAARNRAFEEAAAACGSLLYREKAGTSIESFATMARRWIMTKTSGIRRFLGI